jgi:hypothetical protein
MSIKTGQSLVLSDRRGRQLASVRVERVDANTVFGRFTPGKDYAVVKELFRQWNACANEQLLTHVDHLDGEIAALDLRLTGPDGSEVKVIDLQPSEDLVTLRVESRVSLNGSAVDHTSESSVTF